MGRVKWDQETDVVVAGSGAAGMTAALAARDAGARTLLLERSELYGGTTAMSGGAVWIPGNHLMSAAGVDDSPEDAREYLFACIGKDAKPARIEAYLRAAPEMLKYLEGESHVRFQAMPEYADYYPHAPGSRPGARTLEALPLRGTRLGSELHRLRPPHPQELIFGRVSATAHEARLALQGGFKGRLLMTALFLRYGLDFPARIFRRRKRDLRLTLGNALAGRLRLSLLERETPFRHGARVRELIREGREVVGIEAIIRGRVMRIRARKGIILAAGGFARNANLRRQYQQAPIASEWTAANPLDQGDGILMGRDLGAKLELMDDAWWTPTTVIPGGEIPYLIVVEKSLPGCILVNGKGRRFTNEAAPYADVVRDMYGSPGNQPGDTAMNMPAWLIMDRDFLGKYPCAVLMPRYIQPEWSWSPELKTEWITRGESPEELAAKLGLDAEVFRATLDRFNEHAARGEDPDFHKGENIYDRYYGDPAIRPNPCLRPLKSGPLYAVPIFPGDLGTRGGLVTDEFARVLNKAGRPLAGLYAAGNVSASVMGRTYPGAGGTIGPAMTFGFIAGRHAAAR